MPWSRRQRAKSSIVIATIVLCCRGRAPDPSADEDWRIDSTAYERAITKWNSDSLVIDSVSRLIDTDSLYRLNRNKVFAADPYPFLQPIACERFRLVRRFGALPLEQAMARMNDTLWKGIPDSTIRRYEATKSRPVSTVIGEEACGARGPVGPFVVKGVSMNASEGRPQPPKHR